MKQFVTTGIVLSRTNFGEADRILAILTPDYGKLHLIARGVRKEKSKLAGGIELFSISNITFIRGRNELGTLISTRLIQHYAKIVQSLDKTTLAYDLVKQLDRTTEDHTGPEYFELLNQAFEALDEPKAEPKLIEAWFAMQLLTLGGHTPNLKTDTEGRALVANQKYNFDFEKMAFVQSLTGRYNANHIKLLRLGFGQRRPKIMQRVSGIENLVEQLAPLMRTMLTEHIRI